MPKLVKLITRNDGGSGKWVALVPGAVGVRPAPTQNRAALFDDSGWLVPRHAEATRICDFFFWLCWLDLTHGISSARGATQIQLF